MAKYLILIYGDAQQWDAMTDEQWKAHDAAHEAFAAEAGSRILDGRQVESAATALSLHSDGSGRITTTEGPFLDTVAGLGGYYLLEAAGLDEVRAMATLLPEVHAAHSGVEIRAVVDHG